MQVCVCLGEGGSHKNGFLGGLQRRGPCADQPTAVYKKERKKEIQERSAAEKDRRERARERKKKESGYGGARLIYVCTLHPIGGKREEERKMTTGARAEKRSGETQRRGTRQDKTERRGEERGAGHDEGSG